MKKRFITICLICLMTFGLTSCSAKASSYSVEYNGINYTYEDISELENLALSQVEVMNAAHDMAEAARRLNYEESHNIILTAKREYAAAQQTMEDIYSVIDELENIYEVAFAEKEKEYPEATIIWKYFKQQGYNDYVCAGIMGNLMTEVGGQTLALKPYSSSENYYGMCQWNKAYLEVWGADILTQCKFLDKTMKYEFNSYGNKYKNNFNFEEFKNLKDEKKAALAFVKCYERCGSSSYKIRQNNAETAYKYFVG